MPNRLLHLHAAPADGALSLMPAPKYPHDGIALRPLGQSGLSVSAVALGCWPIAGVTTLEANDADSVATIHRAIECGVNFLDTAYVYGPDGESERLIAAAIKDRRDRVVLATKGGIHYENGAMVQDARPETLRAECEASLARLGVDRVDLLYLHSPDPTVPIEDSAGAMAELQREGKTIAVGASNCTVSQMRNFHGECPLAAVQLPYNMLQRDIEERSIPWCIEHEVAVVTYWPLMKGLLADKLPRDGSFHPNDNRRNYPMYQGEEWAMNQAFLASLREIAAESGKTVAQVVVNWTFNRPGITAALCGAKRPWQIEETASARGWKLAKSQVAQIETALAERGRAAANRRFN